MKSRKLTLLSVTLLASLVLGIFVVEVLAPPKRARVKGRWYPRTWSGVTPTIWNIELGFAPKRSVDEIDTSTILLEGLYSPSEELEPYDRKNRVVVPFDGYVVLAAAIQKSGHLTPGSHLIYLEVSGELEDGTPFSTGMSSVIVLFIDNYPAP